MQCLLTSGGDAVYIIASPFCVLGAMSRQHLGGGAVYIIGNPFCVLGAMSPQHLGGDAVYADVLGSGSGWHRSVHAHRPPRNRRHRHHLYIHVCDLYKRRGQGR